jgi:hypothetical protein
MAKTSYEELTDTAEDMRLYQQERAIEYVTAMICSVMTAQGVTRAELAKRLGKVPGWVTQVLDGEKNKTIRTLSDLLWALGESLEFSHRPIGGEAADTARRNGHGTFTYEQTIPWATRTSPLSTSSRKTWKSEQFA